MEEGDSQVLVCALATLDRWIALGEQLMVGFCREDSEDVLVSARSQRLAIRSVTLRALKSAQVVPINLFGAQAPSARYAALWTHDAGVAASHTASAAQDKRSGS